MKSFLLSLAFVICVAPYSFGQVILGGWTGPNIVTAIDGNTGYPYYITGGNVDSVNFTLDGSGNITNPSGLSDALGTMGVSKSNGWQFQTLPLTDNDAISFEYLSAEAGTVVNQNNWAPFSITGGSGDTVRDPGGLIFGPADAQAGLGIGLAYGGQYETSEYWLVYMMVYDTVADAADQLVHFIVNDNNYDTPDQYNAYAVLKTAWGNPYYPLRSGRISHDAIAQTYAAKLILNDPNEAMDIQLTFFRCQAAIINGKYTLQISPHGAYILFHVAGGPPP